MQTVPARLHVILARRATIGLVIRRGPSREVATLLWDRRDDSVRVGQWLRGRIYERRGDLSPDGRHMIYFAAHHRIDSDETGGSWTAVSRTPWLKALALWGKGDCWQGGGWFTGAREYWLNGWHRELRRSSEVRRVTRDPVGPQENYECLGVYFPRLLRDGWERVGRGTHLSEFARPLARGWRLHKLAHAGWPPGPGRGVYWEEHLLASPEGGVLVRPGWEWAERDGPDVVFAEAGCLWRQAIAARERLGPPRLVHDFNAMAFRPVAAPY